MTPSAWEVLDLVARWVHVIAGIMWVGNSLLFNWLDRNLDTTPEHYQGSGAIWLLHSGGFYYVEKTLLPGQKLPVPLHWFKWQAYTTWLSGLALLIVVYWFGGRASMGGATWGFGAALLVAGWAVYEAMNRFVAPRAPALALVVWLAALLFISWVMMRRLDPRAAYLHVGAMLGTIMAGNVFWTIVPSQRELVASASGEHGADPAVSARAKRVSIHNNYFTFPVIALMVSSHFPALYGHRLNWLLLLVLIVAGAGVRHILNVRWTLPQWKPVLGAFITTSILLLWAILKFGGAPAAAAVATAGPVTFDEVRHVIDRRCAVCHSERPTDVAFPVAPAGVMFDTPEQIVAHAARIRERAYVTRTMPLGNKTNITEAERAVLGRWDGKTGSR